MMIGDCTWWAVAVLGVTTLASPEVISKGKAEVFYPDPLSRGERSAVTMPGSACLPAMCKNGGSCLVLTDKPLCLCKPGFINNNCQDVRLDLTCDHDAMRLQILKSVLSELSVNASALHTVDPRCAAEDASPLYVSLTLSYEDHTLCGTTVKVNETHLIYSNELSTRDPSEQVTISGDLISRTADIQIRFSCVYRYDRVVSLPFPLLTSDSLVTFYVREGEFNVTMTLHPTADFLEPYVQPPIIPLSQRLYIQLQIHGQGPQDVFTLSLEECWATPGADQGSRVRHLLISDGHGNDSTVTIINTGDRALSRFSLQMFHFVRYPEFYIHCRIRLCQPNITHCCERPTTGRYKRDQDDPYRRLLSCGPIRLARSAVSGVENPEPGLSSLLLPGAFAAGAALFLLTLVAVAKAIKKHVTRKGRRPLFVTLAPSALPSPPLIKKTSA